MKSPRRAPFTPSSNPRLWPRRWRQRWLALVLGTLVCAPPAGARDDASNPARPDDLTPAERGVIIQEEPQKQAGEVPLPAFPRASDLIPLRAPRGGAAYTYYIDVNSVRLDADEVLFYTVVIQSADGSSNIIYEGIRCATEEIKSFAYGTRDGRFERMADAQWKYFYNEGVLGYRMDLMEKYACSEAGWAVDADTVLDRLVTHDPRRARVAPRKFDAGD